MFFFFAKLVVDLSRIPLHCPAHIIGIHFGSKALRVWDFDPGCLILWTPRFRLCVVYIVEYMIMVG